MEQGWKKSKQALDSILETLNEIDVEEINQLEEGLENVLTDYERARARLILRGFNLFHFI